jgi:hypothetical protein
MFYNADLISDFSHPEFCPFDFHILNHSKEIPTQNIASPAEILIDFFQFYSLIDNKKNDLAIDIS